MPRVTDRSFHTTYQAMSGPLLRIGWFSSAGGEGSRGLLTHTLKAIDSGRLNARLEFVFSNRARGQRQATDHYFDLVEERGIPLVTLSSYRFRRARGGRPWDDSAREAYDRAVIDRLDGFAPDLCVAAGYMLIAPLLCERFPMVNLHPALPDGPIGTWQTVIWQLIEQRASESGVMVNRVTREVDAGPVVSYCRFPLTGNEFSPLWNGVEGCSVDALREELGEAQPLFRAIREASLQRERVLLPETLIAIQRGRLSVDSTSTGGGVDLTHEVEAHLTETRSENGLNHGNGLG